MLGCFYVMLLSSSGKQASPRCSCYEERICSVAQHGSINLEDLPEEVVVDILQHVGAADLSQVGRSCRWLWRIAGDELTWRNLFRRRFNGLERILNTSKPRWWMKGGWKHRYLRLIKGAHFKAQVYNRELENVSEDFGLSAYDAVVHLEKDPEGGDEPRFVAKYLPMLRDTVLESDVTLSRLRAVPVGTHPHRVFQSTELKLGVGEEVEVQWKGLRGHPFGWWLGVVNSVYLDKVVIAFQQYPSSSPWRQVSVPLCTKKEAPVSWDKRYGFVGGIRKLSEEEREQWEKQTRTLACRYVDDGEVDQGDYTNVVEP